MELRELLRGIACPRLDQQTVCALKSRSQASHEFRMFNPGAAKRGIHLVQFSLAASARPQRLDFQWPPSDRRICGEIRRGVDFPLLRRSLAAFCCDVEATVFRKDFDFQLPRAIPGKSNGLW